jgi:drug/metabolite transporter (DMT)-like permease
MQLSPRLGIAILLGVGVSFASNHLAARVAFDHGASVGRGCAVRASCTALVLLALMQLQGVRLAIPGALRPWSLLAGLLIATQSYCLYSAVARIPAALALLVFQTSPMLYVLLSWAMRKEPPRWRALAPMALGLAGLALALDLRLEHLQARWSEIGAGVLWAFASGSSMAVVYYLNTHVLKGLDGRVRTFAMTAVTCRRSRSRAGPRRTPSCSQRRDRAGSGSPASPCSTAWRSSRSFSCCRSFPPPTPQRSTSSRSRCFSSPG